MHRTLLLALVLAVIAPLAARAAPEEDPDRRAALEARFDPFDKAAGDEWLPAFPTPFFRNAAPGDSDAVTFDLKPGSYMAVTLCNCAKMEVTMIAPGGSQVPPSRSNDQGAMYSLDVAQKGLYLIGVDMAACAKSPCGVAVKVYAKNK